MSDVSDVLSVLAAQCTAFVYPNGTSQPSVANALVRVYAGWPTSSSLDQDLQSGYINVSVFPNGPERNTTRYRPKQQVMSIIPATLTLAISGQVIAVGGAMPSPFTPHNLAVLIAGVAFIYPIQSTDTLTSIATGLAALINASHSGTTSSGTKITLPAGIVPSALRVGTTGNIAVEWERQCQRIQLTVWAPDPTTRNLVSAAIKSSLSQIAFMTMPDGFGARVKAVGGSLSDVLEKAKTYRRDLFYDVEYATTVESNVATVVAAQVQFETQNGTPIVTKTY